MDEPLMPSDARRHLGLPPTGEISPSRRAMQWYIVPAVVAVLLVVVILIVGQFAGRGATIEQEITRGMKDGLSSTERDHLSRRLVDLLDRGGAARGRLTDEYLLLALGRIWQAPLGEPEASPVRREAADALVLRLSSDKPQLRKAAILAFSYWRGNPETASLIPQLVGILSDTRQDLDVRIAAAVTLGSVASPQDASVLAALEQARNLSDDLELELSWNAALALARLGQPSAAPSLLKLMDRSELSQLTIYDREADPRTPPARKLNEYEVERFIINAIEASAGLDDAQLTARLNQLAQDDPSHRVRSTATEILGRAKSHR